MSITDKLKSFADSPGRLLIVALIFHFAITLTIYELGRQAVFPTIFDSQGIAVSYAPDGAEYCEDATALSEKLASGQFRDWFQASFPYHVKLYSISLAALSFCLAPGILSAEPLNALCYVGILILIFRIGRKIFDRRSGLIAAASVGLWPSFVLHTTQLLRDPLYLVGMLAFVLVSLSFLSKKHFWSGAISSAIAGGLLAVFTWLIRDSMGEIMIATVVFALALLVLKQFLGRQLQVANLAGLGLLLVLTLAVIRFVPAYQRAPGAEIAGRAAKNNASQGVTMPPGGESLAFTAKPGSLAARVGEARNQFAVTSRHATSNIDSDVELHTTAEVVRYLPRATLIGLFAPFPNMWVGRGEQTGSVARRLSGVEMIMMYLVEALAFVGLVTSRRAPQRYSIWLVALLAATGVVALGLIVLNVGTLLRLRYLFLFLMIELAAVGALHILKRWRERSRIALNSESRR